MAQKKTSDEQKSAVQSQEMINALRILRLMQYALDNNIAFNVGKVDDWKDSTQHLTVVFNPDKNDGATAIAVDLTDDEWRYGLVDDLFQDILKHRAEQIRVREVARAAYDKLTEDERDALKLRFRP